MSERCPELKVHEEKMHREDSTTNLGDILHKSGKPKYNIIDRTAKAYAILAEIRAQMYPLEDTRLKLDYNLGKPCL